MEIFKLFGTILVDNSKANESLDKSESKAKKLATTFGTGIKAAAAMGTAVVGAATAITEATEETRNNLARLETNATTAGIQLGTTGKAMQELSKFSEELDSNVEAVSNLIAAGLDDEQMLTALDSLSGAAIKFSDTLKIEGIADGFQETLATGMGVGPFAELIERCGYNLHCHSCTHSDPQGRVGEGRCTYQCSRCLHKERQRTGQRMRQDIKACL